MPVGHLSDAGADVFFENDDGFYDRFTDFDYDGAFLEYKKKLAAFGRLDDHMSFTVTQGGHPWNFEETNTSSPIQLALSWIREDIKTIFEELPSMHSLWA